MFGSVLGFQDKVAAPGPGGGGGGEERMAATPGRWISLRGSLAGSVPTCPAASSWPTDAEGVGFTEAEASANRDAGAKVGAVTLPIAMAT